MTDNQIREVIKRHYHGNSASLLAERMFAVAREVADLVDGEVNEAYEAEIHRQSEAIWELTCEIARLKGEEPPKPIAVANGADI